MMCASWVCANAQARLSQGCLAVAYVMNSSLTFKIPYNGSELTSWFLVKFVPKSTRTHFWSTRT